MARWIMRTAAWVFKTDEGNIRMFIFAAFAIILLNNYDVFHLKSIIGDNLAIAIYVLVVFIIYYLMSVAVVYLVEEFVIRPKIQIVPIFEGKITVRYGGDYFEYAELLVEIPRDWELEECYATLTKIKPIYYEDGILVGEDMQAVLSLIGIKSRRLIWKSQYQTDSCKLNIGENSADELLYVAKIEGGYTKTKNKKNPQKYSGRFQFCCCDSESNPAYLRWGLYSISVRLNYTLDGRKMRPKYFEGYIYSSEGDGSSRGKLELGTGDPMKNSDIPKPKIEIRNDIFENQES